MFYPMMEPPFEFESFREMTTQEAKQIFDWHIEQLSKRINVLKEAFYFTTNKNDDVLNLSPSSLIPLWEWYKSRIKIEPITQEELEQLNKLPKWAIPTGSGWKPDLGTVALALDISLYLAEVLLRQFPSLRWSLLTKPKSNINYNHPVIQGFKKNLHFEPTSVVLNLTFSVIRKNKSGNLLNIYEAWSKFV